MYSQRVADAKKIDQLVLDLNRGSGLCFSVVQVLQDKPTHTDAFVYESKYRYTQALRFLKNSNGRLQSATCINFKPEVRFEQPSIAQAMGDAAVALITPELVDRRNLRPGEQIEPVPVETDFALAPVMDGMRRYVPTSELVQRNSGVYGKAFNAIF
jgi:hypothetical protein